MRAHAIAALALLAAACAAGEAAPRSPPGRQEDLVSAAYTPLASGAEVARRALTPLTWRAMERRLAETGQGLQERPIDLARETFSAYVPAGRPPEAGWGVLVFVAPWSDATRPRRWRAPLDRHGVILVSAAGAGNDSAFLDRRLPLALLAYESVRVRYPVDPRRVWIGGFSGGSRVALAAALAYPDVFRGVLLNAGSDPIDGSSGIYVPPAPLFRAFQRTRVVYATGEKDEERLREDRASRASLEARCVLDVAVVTPRRLGHEPLDAHALERALEALERPSGADPGALEACDARLRREVAERLAQAEAAITRGDRGAALERLKETDARYGGLAAPEILELEERRTAMR